MAIRHNSALMAAIGMLVVAIPLSASGSKSGEEVYTQMCSACHSAGVAGAPKVGDQKAWAPLIAEGQHIVTAHGWVGVRAMPPRGGDPGLELEEFARATAHMANTAGGDWGEPDDALLERIRDEEAKRIEAVQQAEQAVSDTALKSGEQVYAQICSACHQGGLPEHRCLAASRPGRHSSRKARRSLPPMVGSACGPCRPRAASPLYASRSSHGQRPTWRARRALTGLTRMSR